jgi:CheY-like chemotaxis protein
VKGMRFVWIDDKKEKVESYRAVIEAGSGCYKASVELLEVKKDLLDELDRWCADNRGQPPDLILIDQVFNATLPFGLNGSSVAHLLRNEFPRVPMVCVTAMFNHPRSFDQEDISEYTALFLYQQLENHIEDLYAVARDFPRLHVAAGGVRGHVVACLKAPTRDREDLRRILPEEFQDGKHATTAHQVARWIFNVFLRRPGFVYDRLHVATLLGLTEEGFAKVERNFGRAMYRGVFATNRDPKWWSSAVRMVLYHIAGENAPDLPQYAGRCLPGITDSDHSVCYVSKKSEPPPDAVVATDTTRDAKRRVVRRQYSASYTGDPGAPPGFETQLILRRSGK